MSRDDEELLLGFKLLASTAPVWSARLASRADILELTPVEVGSALKFWTRHQDYKWAVKTGAVRVDLEGRPAGTVTEAEAEDAAQKLAALYEWRRKKFAEQLEARRQAKAAASKAPGTRPAAPPDGGPATAPNGACPASSPAAPRVSVGPPKVAGLGGRRIISLPKKIAQPAGGRAGF